MRFVYGLGRLMYGAFFVYNGINHLQNAKALEGYAAYKGRPYPRQEVIGSGVLLIASGASLGLGLKPRWGAAGIAAFLGAATPIFHDFWKQEDPSAKQNETIHFSKNLALLAAAVAFMGED